MFTVPLDGSIKDIIETEFIIAEDQNDIKDIFNAITVENKIIIIIDKVSENIIGYFLIENIPEIISKYGEEYKKVKLEKVAKKDFKIIEDSSMLTIRNVEEDIYSNIFILIDENREVIGYITKEKVKAKSLEDIESKYSTLKYLVGQIDEGICAVDKDGIVLLWNSFMENRYNITAEEMVGKKMSDFLEDTISIRVLRTKTEIRDVYYIKQDNGVELYGIVRASPVYYKKEFVGVVCTEVDITDAKKLAKELEVTQEKIKYLEDVISLSTGDFDQILGNCYGIERAKNIARQVSKTNTSVMITGEAGTGKELFARAIHKNSLKKGSFIHVNCNIINQDNFERDFFGYSDNDYEGNRDRSKAGLLEIANGGTLFLDEVDKIPYNVQAQLLRVLQNKEVTRVGGESSISIDIRVISSTSENIKSLLKEGKFRDDLYYFLNVIEIKLPALRDRNEDIGILIYHFLEEECKKVNKPFLKIGKEAFRILEKYEWKDNIRELKNIIENIVVLSFKKTIESDDMPEYIINSIEKSGKSKMYPTDLNEATELLEIKRIRETLEKNKWNKSKTAKILNIPRATLYYKIRKYNIKKHEN
ncbi:sigma 54-interacting transcriptional regulator [Peptostreptococcus faecalis]|uniref:sigma 54-interacting transcriptional regulator n=1 Tax=Peptostreptococcus faecalis TaxID=2045015 RepID=UPI000C7A0404|nr:sigma 54-interacting transcriptional regulator [Peptostreptococcus faecalis]